MAIIDLSSISTLAPKKLEKSEIKDKTEKNLKKLQQLQSVLYAQSKFSVLVILQGLDASGKDGVVKKIFSGVDPLGCDVKAFKAPTEEERAHDFLWRIHRYAPAKGNIQIFNRSHYEDVLVPRVEKWIDDQEIKKRFQHINQFERLLIDSQTLIFKFYLHISPEEQKERFKERLTNPEKKWKYKASDLVTAQHWDEYRKAYHDIFIHCNDPVQWHIIPADQNWYKEYLISKTIIDELEKLPLQYPEITE